MRQISVPVLMLALAGCAVLWYVWIPHVIPMTIMERSSAAARSPQACNVFDLSKHVDAKLECVRMKIQPPTPVCIYPDNVDNAISWYIRHKGAWEVEVLAQFQAELRRDPDTVAVDVGANIGVFSLTAARMGHRTVSVEPNPDNVMRLQRAAQLAGTVTKITLLHNGVSDTRGVAAISRSPDNQGNTRLAPCKGACAESVRFILLDDLLEVIPKDTRRVVMKMDIQGHEQLAFLHAARLFSRLHIPAVFMEWFEMREFRRFHHSEALVDRLVEFFFSRHYRPSDPRNPAAVLTRHGWKTWPFDVVWRLQTGKTH